MDQRSGRRLTHVLEKSDLEPSGSVLSALGRLSYAEAMSWIGACLADALHYAHQSNLVHFDVKPSNILIAADGQPMLLDFHLAREPLRPGAFSGEGVGGTPAYMPSEQRAALKAALSGQPLPSALDRRADVFSLEKTAQSCGLEALGGRLPVQPGVSPSLASINCQVSQGLSDIVAKCLAPRAEDRYADASQVAIDLRCHLSNQPLHGVSNRCWRERFRKWRRRRPTAPRLLVLIPLVLGVTGVLSYAALSHWKHLRGEVVFALTEGRKNYQERGRFADALVQLKQGLEVARTMPWQVQRIRELEEEIRLAELAQADDQRRQALRDLHALADQVRAFFGTDNLPGPRLAALDKSCQEFWAKRQSLRQWLEIAPTPEGANDLLDLALFAIDLQVRLAAGERKNAARRHALDELDEAEALFGPNAVLALERARHRQALHLPPASRVSPPPQTVWEYFTLGRTSLEAGDLVVAAHYLQEGIGATASWFLAEFLPGPLRLYRLGNFAESVAAFSVCIGAAPEVAVTYYNRALGFTALGQNDLALHDYDRVLRLDALASAALNRGMLHFQALRYHAAEDDLLKALELGAPEATVYYDMAMVQAARLDTAAALRSLNRSLLLAPGHPEALALRDRLRSHKELGPVPR